MQLLLGRLLPKSFLSDSLHKTIKVNNRCQGQTPDSGMNRHELTVQHIRYILARTLLHFIISRMSSM